MSLKGILFIGLFFLCALGAVFIPVLGIYGYIIDYCIGTSGQWWSAPFLAMGFRFSFILAVGTLIGIYLNRGQLRYGNDLFVKQEILLLLFLTVVVLSVFIGEKTIINRYGTGGHLSIDHPSIKFAKIALFALMMTHVITDTRKLDGLLWVFVFVALFLGLKAWYIPRSWYVGGRIENIGGADFSDANFFAAFMASMLPFIGIQFMRSRWYGKIVCFFSAVFTVNAIVLCRSRGAFLAIFFAIMSAFFFAPKKYRKSISVILILGIAGGIYLTDQQFIKRITTITQVEEKRDESSKNRLRIWQGGMTMIADYPFGIGAANWMQTISRYSPQDEGMDAHNTLIKCTAELGLQGGFIYILLIFTAFRQLFQVKKQAEILPDPVGENLVQIAFALIVSLVTIIMCGMTITMIYTEIVWLLLMLSVCLRRALNNAITDNEQMIAGEKEASCKNGGVLSAGNAKN